MPKFIRDNYRPGPVDLWLWAALTQFVNGFIAGLGGASVAGLGVGTTTATTDLGATLGAWQQLALSLAALVASAIGNGVKRVVIWHDSNPFPNPFPAPTSP